MRSSFMNPYQQAEFLTPLEYESENTTSFWKNIGQYIVLMSGIISIALLVTPESSVSDSAQSTFNPQLSSAESIPSYSTMSYSEKQNL